MNKFILNLAVLLCACTGAMAQNNVGVNTNAPGSTLSVNGNAAIGTNYATQAAPTNGAAIEGNVGIGVLLPTQKLEVAGNTKTTNFQMTNGAAATYVLQSDANGNGTWVLPSSLGVTGPAGATGPQGPIGATGATGAVGATGPQGLAGNDGAMGTQGPAGNDGAMGTQGPAGNDGAMGTQGPAGNDGAIGPQGPAGNDGAMGPQGLAGNDGAIGPQGPAGNDGAMGPQGPAGNDGAAGPQGTAGATGATGATGPAGTYTTGTGINITSGTISSIATLDNAYTSTGAGAGRTINANNGAVLIAGNDGFQNTGTFGSGATLGLSGSGTRMFFYPKKAAFRAGYANTTQWDDINIGNYSTAIGFQPKASGDAAVAIGNGVTASGIVSLATGYTTVASGNYATAMGNATIASGLSSTAMGYGTAANGSYSTTMGYGTTATGQSATAMGNTTSAIGNISTAMGQFTTASADYTLAAGYSTTAQAYAESTFGEYNTNAVSPNPTNWIATDRLFTIGNGTSSGAKSNALVILKNGNTTLKGALTLTNGTSSFTLPQIDGTANQVLATNGSGVVSWVSPAGGGSTLNGAYNFGGAGAGRTITASSGAVLVDGNDGFQNTGTLGSGATLALSGAGTKMFFYPKKAAFRAGYVDATQWNDANIGQNSTALGINTTASGAYSTALGHGTIANSSFSTAIGTTSTASGMYAIALGLQTTASGSAATSMGYGSLASGFAATATGYTTTASGAYATALGYYTSASADYTTAIGEHAVASGIYGMSLGTYTTASGGISTAIGHNSTASGDDATALGYYTIASGKKSIAMGEITTAESYAETAIGAFNTSATTPDAATWVATDRLFTVGNGTSSAAKSNALIILKNGSSTFTGTVTAPSFVISSDKRFKKNIVSLNSVSGLALNNLENIGSYYYEYRKDEFPERQFTDTRQIGFIAQELEAIYPELVATDDKGYKSVDYAKMTPILVEAIKELKAQNEALTLKATKAEASAEKAEANFELLKVQVEKLNNATFGNAQK